MLIFFKEYLNIFIYFLFSLILASVMILVAKILAPNNSEAEKLSAYECGFEPFSNARIKFDITFSTIAILYLIFDLEIVFLIPWVISAVQTGVFGYCSVLIFLLLLMGGFAFEWWAKALDWRISN